MKERRRFKRFSLELPTGMETNSSGNEKAFGFETRDLSACEDFIDMLSSYIESTRIKLNLTARSERIRERTESKKPEKNRRNRCAFYPNSIGNDMLSMHKIFNFLLMFLVCIIFFIPKSAFSQEKPIAKLADFSGTVLIKSQGSWGVKPVKGLPLYSMDKLVTRIGNATIVFHDGATVNIKNNSNLLINEQEKTKGLVKSVKRQIMLFLGKLNFKTGKSAVETQFETTRAVIGIRGTAGILSIGADGKTYIYFSEGGAKYILGDFIRGIAKEVPAALADQNPDQRSTFVAKAAMDQVARTEKMVAAGKMPSAQLDLAKAIAKETSALETLTLAESMLTSPDKKRVEWAKQQIIKAKETIKEAKKDQKNAIKNGADPSFKGFTGENPGFNVPLEQNKKGATS